MHTLISLIPLAVMIGVYAAYLKLSARLLRYTQVTWVRCLGLAAIVTAISIGGRFIWSPSSGMGAILLGLLFGFVGHVVLGGLLFRQRALDSTGQPLRWSGGAKLTALSFLMLTLTGVLLAVVGNSLSPPPKL